MNILFWNVKRKNNVGIIENLIKTYELDLVILAESENTGFERLCTIFGDYAYVRHEVCTDIKMLCKSDYNPEIVMGTGHGFPILVEDSELGKLLIVGCHLSSDLNQDGQRRRMKQICELQNQINQYESKFQEVKTILIGDFNCSPFDDEMIDQEYLNAVLYKSIIQNKEYNVWEHERYRRFYNPMVSLISEDDEQWGSYYYCGGKKPLYWFCFDQVLLRRSLINSIHKIEYLKSIGDTSFMTKNKLINKRYSDHLPLLVVIRE